MELLMLVLLWPLLIFAVGVVSLVYLSFSLFWVIILALVITFVLSKRFTSVTQSGEGGVDGLEMVRGTALVFSISLLWPVFSRFLVEAMENSLVAIIAVLIIGFGLVTWGMFIRERKGIMYSNIFGGALTIFYAYQQLWSLSEGAKVIAAAFGLIVAVSIAVFKLKDKLK